MTKTYQAPQAFDEGQPLPIPMQEVESSQVRAIGYDAASRALAVQFKYGAGALYQYPDVEQATFDAFVAAESKGAFFKERIKPLAFRKFKQEQIAQGGEA